MARIIVKRGPLKRTRNRTPEFHIGCPLTHNRSSWCNQLCVPLHGRGPCGRIAAHALRGRTQKAIDKFKQHTAAQDCGSSD